MALISIFNRRETNQPAAHPLPAANAVEPPALPPLVLLTADAAGPSVRRILTFPDAESAADHIQFWFPVSERSSVIAFWALSEEPVRAIDGEANGEPESACATADSAPPLEVEVVVLVQHPDHPDSVYPFSFVDMDTANRFIRQESKRGLDLRSVSVYWGAFAKLEQHPNGAVAITPATPPAPAATVAPEVIAEPAAEPQAEPDPPAAQPASDPLASYTPPAEPTTLNEIIRDLAGALNVSRKPREQAFRGFGSPPGRF